MADYAAEEEFNKLFARALKRKYLSLIKEFFTQKRYAVIIDLTEAYALADKGRLEEFFVEKKIEMILSLLPEKKKRILQEYIYPSNETIEYAIADFMRKRHLYYADARKEHPTFYVGKEHIAKTLKISPSSVGNVLRYILTRIRQGELECIST
jgi:hypothetical protein